MKTILLILFLFTTSLPQSNRWYLFDGEQTYAGDAKGDGVTDDFLALQTYINANGDLDLSAAAGKTFLISQPLFPKSNSTWNLGTATIKMMDGDSCLILSNYQKDRNYVKVANPSLFKAGQWAGVVDDSSNYSSGNLIKYGWTDSIASVSNDTVYFAHTLNYEDTITTTMNGRIGHVQSCIIADRIENWTLNGGTIDNNGFSTNQIKIHPVYTYGGNGENLSAGTGISIMGCKNIIIQGTKDSPINIVNGITHNVVTASWQGLQTINSEDVRLNYVNLNKARMKNLWVRETDTLTVNVAICDSALREDAIVGYTNVAVMTIDSAFITHWGRHGLLFNGNSGGACDSLNATNIFLDSALSNSTSAITLKGTRAWVNGFTVKNGLGLTNKNRIAVTNQYDGTNNINFLNGTLTSINDTAIINIRGDIGRVNFTNMALVNCTGTAVQIDTFATGTPNVIYDGFPDTVTFTGGSISGLTGSNFDLQQTDIKDSTKFISSNFVYTINKPTALTAVMDTVSITPSWTDPTGDDGTYDSIYVYSAATNDTTAAVQIDTVDLGVQTYANTGLNDGDVKFYWLKTKDILGNTSYFSAKTFGLVLTSAITKIWLEDDVANITKDANNKVANWDDLTSEDHDIAQADTSKAPTWSSSGLLFDGANDFMKATAFGTNQMIMVYIVLKQVSWTLDDFIFDGNTDAKVDLAQTATTPGLKAYAGSSGTQNDELAVGTFGLVTVGFKGTSSRMRVNNNAEVNVSLGTNNNTGFCLGSIGSGTGYYSNIQVKAVIYRSVNGGSLDSEAIQTNIRNYLNAKYSLW